MRIHIANRFALVLLGFAAFSTPSAAAPKPITFTPPMYAAKTLQVSEAVFNSDLAEGKKGIYYGPLLQTGTVTLSFQIPQITGSAWNMHVEWKQRRPVKSTGFLITAGSADAYFADGKFRPFPKYTGFWYDQMMISIVAINSYREQPRAKAVSAVPAARNGKIVLLEVTPYFLDPRDKRGTEPTGYFEKWYDPKTHLLLQDSSLTVEHGRTTEIERVTYSGWKLNTALPPSLFVIPPGAVQSN